jgi:hypothetical protein
MILNDNADSVIVQGRVMKVIEQDGLAARLKRHFHEVLAIGLDPQRWAGAAASPAFLREAYTFHTAAVLGTQCLFMMDRGKQPNTPAAIRKHMFEVGKRWDGGVVYVAAGIDSARRKQLIDQKVPFVIPGNQVYLPMLGVDLREHFKSVRGSAESLSPAAQAAFLHLLHRGEGGALSVKELAAALGYSSMSISRAFDELESAGIGTHFIEGKRRLMDLDGPRRGLWERALPLLRSPVAERMQMPRSLVNGKAAGLTALAAYTKVAAPRIPVAAIAVAVWRPTRNKLLHGQISGTDSPGADVEAWTYPPTAVADGPVVDRLSLYLSLRSTADERVEAALEDLLEGMNW